MPPHRMRLKGPWEYEWLAGPFPADEKPSVPKTGRVKMPVHWRTAFGTAAGRVRFRRRFGLPTNLDPGERVCLAFDGIGGDAEVTLNDRPLIRLQSSEETVRIEITAQLQRRNELAVEVEFDPQQEADKPGGLWAPVALEIHAAE